MNLPKAILLDLDDTILDFSGGVDACWQAVCERYAPELPGVDGARLRAAIEAERSWYWADPARHRRGRADLAVARREIVRGALRRLDVDARDLAVRMADAYTAARPASVRMFPGALEALARLRALGIRLALVTNGGAAEQRAKIERFQLAPLFDCMLIEGEFGAGKPDERVYRHALAQLRAQADEAWTVGDHLEWDVAVPQRLGMAGIWCDVEGQGLPEGTPTRPDRIVRSIAELVHPDLCCHPGVQEENTGT